jgi:osmotically-inducible protein OsmY
MKKFNPLALVLAAFLAVGLSACMTNPRSETPGQYVDDTAITTKVKAAIFNEPTLKSAEINVETFKQVVQLSGFVTSQANIDRATTLAREVNGVQSVKNDMRLK